MGTFMCTLFDQNLADQDCSAILVESEKDNFGFVDHIPGTGHRRSRVSIFAWSTVWYKKYDAILVRKKAKNIFSKSHLFIHVQTYEIIRILRFLRQPQGIFFFCGVYTYCTHHTSDFAQHVPVITRSAVTVAIAIGGSIILQTKPTRSE